MAPDEVWAPLLLLLALLLASLTCQWAWELGASTPAAPLGPQERGGLVRHARSTMALPVPRRGRHLVAAAGKTHGLSLTGARQVHHALPRCCITLDFCYSSQPPEPLYTELSLPPEQPQYGDGRREVSPAGRCECHREGPGAVAGAVRRCGWARHPEWAAGA